MPTTPAGSATTPPGETRTSACPTIRRRVILTVPIALVVVAIVVGIAGAAMSSRPLLATSFVAGAIAAILFVMLPVLEMARSRGRD